MKHTTIIPHLCGAVLDMDGTVLDSMPCWETVGIRYLLDRKIEIPDIPALALRLKTTTVPMAAEIYREEFGVTDDVPTIVDEIHDMIAADYRYHAPLKPHVYEALCGMKNSGVRLCVATATDETLAKAALGRLGVLELLDFVVTCDQLHTSKNEPKIFDYAAEKLGVPADGVVVFEDSLHAIQTAHNAGYRCVGVYDKSSEPERNEIRSLCEEYLWSWEQFSMRHS